MKFCENFFISRVEKNGYLYVVEEKKIVICLEWKKNGSLSAVKKSFCMQGDWRVVMCAFRSEFTVVTADFEKICYFDEQKKMAICWEWKKNGYLLERKKNGYLFQKQIVLFFPLHHLKPNSHFFFPIT